MFLANSAYVQASVLWVTLTPLLFKFHSYATTRYGEAVAHMYVLHLLRLLAAKNRRLWTCPWSMTIQNSTIAHRIAICLIGICYVLLYHVARLSCSICSNGDVGKHSSHGCRPLETSHAAPEAKVDPIVYTPPALRPGCAGWYPEHGKAWENWGVPAYVP